MKKHLLIAIAALFVSAVAPVVSMTGQAYAQAATATSDEAVVAAVKKALAEKPELKANDLKVTSKHGEVTLAGDVEDGRTLYAIGLVVQKVEGVKYVMNEMMPKH